MFHTGKFNKIPLRKRTKKKTNETESSDGIPKLPRLELPPSFLEPRCNPLYRLPDELLYFVKNDKSAKTVKTRRHRTTMQSFSAMREAKQNFRRKLLDSIVRENDRDSSGIPSAKEKKLLRYYYYIKHGIDTEHVAPPDERILQKIYKFVPQNLKKWSDILAKETEDMKRDFSFAMKKAIVDFALRDPELMDTIDTDKSGPATDASWNQRMQVAKLYLSRNLHTINPCMAQVLDIWWNQFISLRLIDIDEFVRSKEAYTIEDFQTACKRHIESAINSLKTQWLPSLRTLFLAGAKKGIVPGLQHPKKMKKFYDCLSCIMTYHLQTLCLTSIKEYTDYILDIGGANQGFFIDVVFNKPVIAFYPPFNDGREVLLNIYDSLIEACETIPRLETQLYQDYPGEITYLKPVIDLEYIDACKKQVHEMLEDQRIGPELRMQDFDDYIALINGETDEEIKKFLESQPPKSFDEFCQLATKFVKIAIDIPMKLEHTVVVGIYKMNRQSLLSALKNAATNFGDQLLEKMTTDYQVMIKEIGDEYQEISNRLLTAPLNTAELVEKKQYSKEVNDKILEEMEERLKNVMRYITFLSDYTSFTPLEMKANNNTFHWYARMPSILEECNSICEVKALEYQESLKERIEKFNSDLVYMSRQAEELQNWGDLEQLHKYVTRATSLHEKLNNAMKIIDGINEEEIAFEWEQSQYPLRKQISDKLAPYKRLYDNADEYLKKNRTWMSSKVGSHDPEEIESDVGQYYKTVYKLEKTFANTPAAFKLANDVRLKIEDFRQHIPIVQTLGNPGMKARHWEKVSEIVGFPITVDDSLTLEKIIDYGLSEYTPKFEVISEAATKENTLEKNLDKMMNEWQDLKFEILPYRDTGTYILSSIDDIQLLLDDHIVKTQTMKNSPYIKPFETTIIMWEGKLQLLQDILDEWLHVQAIWMYLEPIFSSPDIQQQMPEESRKFSTVDKTWREIMKIAFTEPNVLDVIEIEKMLERLKKSNSLLEVIQFGLNAYLEKKRLYFPRFFFLSNDELLEILSETKDPTRVQPHLKKCFEGIARLTFTEDLFITHMKSSQNEVIPLVSSIDTTIARGQVEKWLLDLEHVMKNSIQTILLQAFEAYNTTPRPKWVIDWAGQVVQCIAMTYWTSEVAAAISESHDKLQEYLVKCNEQVSDIVNLVRGNLSTQNRITLGALIVLDVHARDIVSELITLQVQNVKDFKWLCHLRYYWETVEEMTETQGDDKKKMKMTTHMINSKLMYGNEYLGNVARLVVTPLTDRCFRTLFEALNLHLGGAPEGPAGTGKTETTKDLAKAIAKQCVVFNCSDGLDYIALGKFFKGLASCGAWSCFDEFNRIDLEVLSVVAQQILSIQRGILAGLSDFLFEGTLLKLDPECAVFITMNPGYAGRSELPDNLKALFRPVAMMVPDYSLISQIELYASGYLEAQSLAVKIVATYKLCSEQLSSQSHYDYGMRAVKSVLRAAASLKIRFQDENEDIIIYQSIKDVNLPKFLCQDVPLFMDILSDLFPGLSPPQRGLPHLIQCFEEACKAMNVQSVPVLVEKALQLYEMILIRHGLMIVGLPFAGKTTLYRALADALGLVSEKGLMEENKVQYTVINPKSITMGQLYGSFDPVSHEWSDGILPISYRTFAVSTTPDRKWLVFDGPIDAVWIENLNTVLDDNKKLCLLSGEIIQLGPTTNLIFETMDLEAASPATVSRCGMIYMEPDGIGWAPLLESWMKTLPKALNNDHINTIRQLFHRFIPPLLWLITSGDVSVMCSTLKLNLVKSTMNLFDTFMDDFSDEKYVSGLDDISIRSQLEGVFFFSAIWSMGSTLEAKSRPKFDMMFRGLLDKEFPQSTLDQLGYPEQTAKPEKTYIFTIPKDETVFDYRYIKEGKGKWKLWTDELMTAPPIPRDTPAHCIIVTTLDTIRYLTLFKLLVYHKKNVLVIGPTGTGKSSYITDFLLKKANTKIYKSLIMAFSAKTSANQTQDTIMSKLDKRKKGYYGPPIGTQCVIFVDDVSMPQVEIYGAQPPIEVLRQALDQRLWYNRTDNTAMNLLDIQFMCAMSKPASGAKGLTPRFVRHFGLLCIDEFDDSTLMLIFSKIMLWHLDTRGFSKEFDPCIEEIVSGTLNIYKNCKLNLLPIPSKPHYMFNLRDFSRVIQGVLLSVPEAIEDLLSMKRLWVHECLRVFSDRLVDNIDRDWFIDSLRSATQTCLKEDFDVLFEKLAETPGNKISDQDMRKLIYCDFANPKADTRHYMEVSDMDNLSKTISNFLFEFNNMTKKPMNLVLFRFAIEHVCRICRILSQPRSNALLIGLGGSGRQSLSRLAGHINDYELFQIEISKSYGMNEWKEDMKSVFKKASVPDQHVIFLFNESQIKDESFVEDINSILNSGEVPNLYNPDEKAELYERMRVIDKQRDKSLQTDGTPPALHNIFIDMVREQLHMVLVMSPAGSSLRTRIRKFPAIVNCSTIDWFQEWPEDALLAVATNFLKDIDLKTEERTAAINMCQIFHNDTQKLSKESLIRLKQHNYVTPTAYLELITLFKSLLASKRLEVLNNKKRYVTGLEQLEKAGAAVVTLQSSLKTLKPKLAEGAAAVAATSAQVAKEKEDVAVIEENVLVDQKEADEQARAAQVIKDDCDADLALAMPKLEEAMAALDTIQNEDIVFMKSMKNPPKGIKLVMEAICVIKGIKPDRIPNPDGVGKIQDYWGPSKKVLSDIKFLESLQLFDKDNIPPAIIEKLQTSILTDESFVQEKMRQASKAAESLYKWIIAMVNYDEVNKNVAPKKKALADAQAVYNNAMGALAIKQAELKKVQDKLKRLEDELEEQGRQQKLLDDEVELCENKLTRAEMLLQGLGGEKKRWNELIKLLDESYEHITGNILISAGVIAYLGPFIKSFREQTIKKWCDLCNSYGIEAPSNFKISTVLGNPVVIQQWNIDGLPTDDFSIESAIIVKTSNRWPLMMDPQGQANNWIKKMESPFHLNIVRMSQSDLGRVLENAIQFGQPVLLENVGEELDPMLEPLLMRQTFKQGGAMYIKLGDNVVEYNDKFRFYISTKLKNPHYYPEVSVKVTIVNFMLGKDGLVSQLLSRIVALERPELHQAKIDLISQNAEHRRILKDTEDKILNVLSSSETLLEDEAAVQILNSSKMTADEINEKQITAAETEIQIDKTRKLYEPIAVNASVLFFLIGELSNIDPMYQFSLGWFENIYSNSIENTEKVDDIQIRLSDLKQHLTYSLYKNVCQSLFEKDKLVFSLLLSTKLLMHEKKLTAKEFMFLLTGENAKVTMESPIKDVNALGWAELQKLEKYEKFENISKTILENEDAWEEYVHTPDPSKNQLPSPWKENLNDFEELMLMRCMRKDKLVPAVRGFIEGYMGRKFVEPPLFNLEASYLNSNCCLPLLFILTPGSDPMQALLKFANDLGFGESRLFAVSLGQGQGPIASKLIEEAIKVGNWIVLQNCHLAKSWMPTLEKTCEGLQPDTTHPDFRLWLTSYPCDDFPIYVLQNCVKMTNEPPQGLRENILRSFKSDPISNFEWFESNKQGVVFKKFIYSLCFFHAVIQERRQFGPLGWNIRYEFNETDLKISLSQLNLFLNQYEEVPFEALRYLTGECNYGGRVTDDWDRRCLRTMLKQFYKPDIITTNEYSFFPGYDYHLPNLKEYADFIAYLQKLPVSTPPGVFGMNDNADISKHYRETAQLVDTAALSQENISSGTTEMSPEDRAKTAAIEVLARLPERLFAEKGFETETDPRKMHPLSVVLIQEGARYTKLLNLVKASLKSLISALDGYTPMNENDENLLTSIIKERIPAAWLAGSYPSLKSFTGYIQDFMDRMNFMQRWHVSGRPTVFWFSGLYFPQAFLTSVQQSFARKYKIPIDRLAYRFEVESDAHDEKAMPTLEDGAYIKGLFLEAARWCRERKTMDEALPNVLYDAFPILRLVPVRSSELDERGLYACPLYKTADRRGVLSTTGHSTNFVLSVGLPTLDREPDHWILRGAALLTQLP